MQRSAISFQRSAISHQPSAISRQLSIRPLLACRWGSCFGRHTAGGLTDQVSDQQLAFSDQPSSIHQTAFSVPMGSCFGRHTAGGLTDQVSDQLSAISDQQSAISRPSDRF